MSAAVVAGALLVGMLSPASAERYKTTPSAWGWYSSVSASTLNSYMSNNGMRLTDIEVTSSSGPTFAATMVKNSGVHHKPSWHWWYGLTYSQLTNLSVLTNGSERVLDLESYLVNGVRRYAVVTVNNQGTHARSWFWYINVTPSFISTHLSNRRILDIDPNAGTSNYNIVGIANTGSEARSWWYYYKQTPAQISSLLNTNSARLVDIEADGSGTFTVVMVGGAGEYWWWLYGTTTSVAAEVANQNGARIVDVERYSTSSGSRLAVLMLNNVNSLSTKVREIMRPASDGTAAFGFYAKQVGGPVLAAIQDRKVFEPASTIKALHHLHAMRRVRAGADSLTNNVTWYAHPDYPARYVGSTDYGDDKNVCAYDDDGTKLTSTSYSDDLGPVILKQMMEQSDNRATDAVVNRFGFAAINATADLVGMTKTHLYHRIGCTSNASPAGFHSNELTLHDAGLLYEKVADGTLLGTGTYRTKFYEYMLDDPSGWKTVVDQEAAKLGKSQATADAFLAQMTTAVKGGSYTNGATCPSGVTGVCWLMRRTGFGVLGIPFKSGSFTLRKNYVYGSFVDGTYQCGPSVINSDGDETACDDELDVIGTARQNAHFEMLRPQIKAALQTW